MTMGGEEAAAMLPKERPDLFAVSVRNFQVGQFFSREEFETPFIV